MNPLTFGKDMYALSRMYAKLESQQRRYERCGQWKRARHARRLRYMVYRKARKAVMEVGAKEVS